MKRTLISTAAIILALAFVATKARAQCPDAWVLSSASIKGKHYDATGTETKVKCDTNSGDHIGFMSCYNCSSPPTRTIELVAGTPECQKLNGMFVIIGRTENQIVKNGTPKNECLFVGAERAGGGGSSPEYPYIQTVKKFDSSAVAKSEKGVFSYATSAGEMFVGKIKVKY